MIIENSTALASRGAVTVPPEHDQPWDGIDYFGASLQALCFLAERKGYQLVHTDLTPENAFFARADLAGARLSVGDDVLRRREPNYALLGLRHPPDPAGGQYITVTDPR